MFDFLDKSINALNTSKVFNEGTMISILNLLINATDTNKGNQQFILKTFKQIDLSKDQFQVGVRKDFILYDCLLGIISQRESLRMAGFGCLLASHLTWTTPEGQSLLLTPEFCQRLIELADFNELINMGEAEATVESLMEISLYALLALINLS